MKREKPPKLSIVHPEIERYMRALADGAFPPADGALTEMETLAAERDFPVVGRLAGRFLFQQALLSGARAVFEMGSGFGYSAYWFAKALAGAGRVFCSDLSAENAALAGRFMKSAGLEKTVFFQVGDAVEILKKTQKPFDIIFNDIEKSRYPEAFTAAREKIRKGGLFISDNAFWDGRVVASDGSPDTEGALEFNRMVMADSSFLTVQIPIRDGISVSLKIA